MTGPEQAEFYERAAAVGDEPATEYGFVGRDLDIQAIEHRLLAAPDGNQLLVQGMAGAGKVDAAGASGLVVAAHRPGPSRCSGSPMRTGPGPPGRSSATSAPGCCRPAEHAQADTMSERPRPSRSPRCCAPPGTCSSWTTPNRSPPPPPRSRTRCTPAEQQTSSKPSWPGCAAAGPWCCSAPANRRAWLTAGSTGPGIYPLPGLDPQAASLLVERILARHGAGHYLNDTAERGALQELVTLLGGYPLPLTVVLPVLADATPSAVLAELKAGGPGADPAGLIRRAIEYSHGKLDPALQNSLLLLAPFTAVIPHRAIPGPLPDLLFQDEAVQALGPVDLAAALDQAVTVGLAAPHPQLSYLVQVQPVLPYFLRSRLHDQPALRPLPAKPTTSSTTTCGRQLHKHALSADRPEQRATGQAATRAEYANLTTRPEPRAAHRPAHRRPHRCAG